MTVIAEFATGLSDHGSLQSIFKERASMAGQDLAFFNLRDEVVIQKTIAWLCTASVLPVVKGVRAQIALPWPEVILCVV